MRLFKSLMIFAVFCTVVTTTWADEYIVDNDDGAPGYVSSGSWTIRTRTPASKAALWVSVYIQEPTPRGNVLIPRIISAFCQAARTSESSNS